MVDALEPHLRTRTGSGREQARATARRAVIATGLIPIGGDIGVGHATEVVSAVLAALAQERRLNDRALAHLRSHPAS
ncbi:hypothetical protein HDA32_005810 [Spinactinospora alkalitolerans]|uniref:Uncharacterized protein n=1 Tax=Spinactinospora alkalitolerans TaxID=687207 RepID=A0A852U9R0_9ACTN|nr:hypothetical protein [Spinactinospora alkalitolerans]NYE50690.1 hypothetical protein [Spinactinospora alkalitolerans]